MSTLLNNLEDGTLRDRQSQSYRESPEHGPKYPAKAVLIENDVTTPVPVQVVDGEPGTPQFFTSEFSTTPGAQQELLSVTVGASILDLYLAKVVCRQHGKFRVTLDNVLIGSGRTGPSLGELSTFKFTPRRPIQPGQIIKVLFTSLSGTPISEVEAYLNGSERSS